MTTLTQKLCPDRFIGMSAKMAAIIGYILDETYTDPTIDELNITSDGMVIAWSSELERSTLIGDASDLERNLLNLIKVAGLTDEETKEFLRLLRRKVTDWRRERGFLKR